AGGPSRPLRRSLEPHGRPLIDAPGIIEELLDERPRVRGSTVVGIAGAVSAGKSVLAASVARVIRADSVVDVVSTDDFLFPNDVLIEHGLLVRKGFPESYDVDALRAFVDQVQSSRAGVAVPVYSHEIYDIVRGECRVVAGADVVIVEGVNALSALADQLDLGV